MLLPVVEVVIGEQLQLRRCGPEGVQRFVSDCSAEQHRFDDAGFSR